VYGNFYKDVFDVALQAREKGINIVRSSRVPTGPTCLNGEVDDDKYHFVASLTLNPPEGPRASHARSYQDQRLAEDSGLLQQVLGYEEDFNAIALALGVSTVVFAQGGNTRMGGEDGDYQSLSERVLKARKEERCLQLLLQLRSQWPGL